MADTKVFDPSDVLIVFGVIPVSSGYADGTFVTISQSGPNFTKKVGTDGQVTRSKNMDRSGQVKIKLMNTSDANNLLTAMANLDLLASNGAGIVPMTIRDKGGNQVFFAAESWISAPPEVSFDKEATEREWTFDFSKSERVDGGS